MRLTSKEGGTDHERVRYIYIYTHINAARWSLMVYYCKSVFYRRLFVTMFSFLNVELGSLVACIPFYLNKYISIYFHNFRFICALFLISN